MNIKRLSAVIALLALIALCGCTEEKANALQVAAKQFRNESIAAITLYESLTLSTITLPQENQEKTVAFIVGKLKEHEGEVTPEIFSSILAHGQEADPASAMIKDEFAKLKSFYTTFNAMFDSVKEGHFFNAQAVDKAQHVCIKLTLQLINYADNLKKRDGYLFSAERALALEELNAAIAGKKDAEISAAVRASLNIRDREKAAKDAVIVQILKAAESGRIVTESIRSYDSITTNDILNNIKTGLNTFAGLNIRGQDIDEMITRYDAFAKDVHADPYWAPILQMKLN